MQQFGTAEVSRLTDIPVRSVRAMVRAQYVIPGRGPRGSLRFSFQDLVLLRTARDLLVARMSPRRVGAALRAMRAQLPDDYPSGGLTVTAAGDRVVVHQGGEKRDALSGQLLLALEVRVDGDSIQFIDAKAQADRAGTSDADCTRKFEAALALEDSDVDAAVEAYRDCVTQHAHEGAVANLGRLLHLRGRISEAVQLYRSVGQPGADILYNLGVALEDLGRKDDAIKAYEDAIQWDAELADAYWNVSELYHEQGRGQAALRAMKTYLKLTKGWPR